MNLLDLRNALLGVQPQTASNLFPGLKGNSGDSGIHPLHIALAAHCLAHHFLWDQSPGCRPNQASQDGNLQVPALAATILRFQVSGATHKWLLRAQNSQLTAENRVLSRLPMLLENPPCRLFGFHGTHTDYKGLQMYIFNNKEWTCLSIHPSKFSKGFYYIQKLLYSVLTCIHSAQPRHQ